MPRCSIIQLGYLQLQTANPPSENFAFGVAFLIVIFTTGVFAYVKESKSAKITQAFESTLDQTANVLRECVKETIPAELIVLGDILFLETGDIVPADCRILECSDGFSVDNSCVTGEAEPIKLDATATHEKMLFSRNMAFYSSCVVRGRAKAVVTRTVQIESSFSFGVALCYVDLLSFFSLGHSYGCGANARLDNCQHQSEHTHY